MMRRASMMLSQAFSLRGADGAGLEGGGASLAIHLETGEQNTVLLDSDAPASRAGGTKRGGTATAKKKAKPTAGGSSITNGGGGGSSSGIDPESTRLYAGGEGASSSDWNAQYDEQEEEVQHQGRGSGAGAAAGAGASGLPSKATFIAAARRCVLLERLPANELTYVYQSCKRFDMFAGEAVYSQDDTPNMLFLVHSGLYRAQVELSGDRGARHARDYRPKENFGACELLCPIGGRSCTVIVVNGGVLWGVPKRVVDTKLKIAPPLRVPGLIDFVCTIKLFGSIAFTRGGRERLTQLCRGVELLELKPDEPVCEQGDAARTIYVVHKGSVYTRQSGTDFSLTMRVQESFGESALFADDELRTRQAAIYAGRGGASILCWDVSKIETLVGFELQAASTQLFNRKMLESARCAGRLLVEGLETGAVDALAAAMVERVTPPLGVLCEEGAYDDALRMVKSGSAVVRRAAKTADIAELRRGDCVGESALLPPEVLPNGKRSRRKTSIVAQGGTPLVTLALSESSLLDAAMQNNRLHAWRNVVIETIASRHTAGIDWIVMDRINEAGGHAPSLLGLERKEAKGKGEKAAPTSGGLGASGTAGRAVAKPRGSGVHPTAGDESRRAATAAGPAAAASSSRRVVPRPSGAKKAVRRMSKALSEGLAQFAASGVTGTGGGAPSAAAGAAATQERSRQQTPPPPLRGPGGKLRRMSQALFGGSAGQLVSGAANAGAGGPPDALDNPEGGLYKA